MREPTTGPAVRQAVRQAVRRAARHSEYRFFDQLPPPTALLDEVVEGLTEEPKRIAPKFFYDERGSRLFEAITRLPEYYLTRTEMGLFDGCLPDVHDRFGEGGCLVEYGAGSTVKIRRLLEELRPKAYLPVDISRHQLEQSAQALHADYPHLSVYPLCADMTAPFELPEVVAGLDKLGFYPGSSIGNFEPDDAHAFLRQVAATLGVDGRLLIGVDRKKDVGVLEAAYNDTAGVTAEFNLNILHHLNSALATEIDPAGFRHRAHYNPELGCVQMFLECLKNQSSRVDGRIVEFTQGELVHTENSYKYGYQQFTSLAEGGGFKVEASWSDPKDYFTLFLLRAR